MARAAAAAAEREEEERERAAVRSTLERFIMLVDTVEYESEEWAMLKQWLLQGEEEWALLKQPPSRTGACQKKKNCAFTTKDLRRTVGRRDILTGLGMGRGAEQGSWQGSKRDRLPFVRVHIVP